MQFVHFPDSLVESAPAGTLSSLYTSPDNVPAKLLDLIHAITRGETVTVRPATASELKRAEAIIALVQIGSMIGEKFGVLLDQEPENVLHGQLTAMREAMEESVMHPPEILDREPGAPSPFVNFGFAIVG